MEHLDFGQTLDYWIRRRKRPEKSRYSVTSTHPNPIMPPYSTPSPSLTSSPTNGTTNDSKSSRSSSSSSLGRLNHREDLEGILSSFPPGIDFAFGYGSGVFSQQQLNTNDDNTRDVSSSSSSSSSSPPSPTTPQPMIDLILVPSCPLTWHEANLSVHPDHYASLPRRIGPSFIRRVQEWGAGVYFHPMVPIPPSPSNSHADDRLVKYGVLSRQRLRSDLLEWESLYIAGRMHKPVLPLRTDAASSSSSGSSPVPGYDDEIYEWQQHNLRSALSTALLLQTPLDTDPHNSLHTLELHTLFRTIAGLSYTGDPRVSAGAEDPEKVTKLVSSDGQEERFLDLYQGVMDDLCGEGVLQVVTGTAGDEGRCDRGRNRVVEVDLRDGATRNRLWADVPRRLCPSSIHNPSSNATNNEIVASVRSLTDGLAKIVGPPARVQSVKGLVTAGVYRSLVYAGAKLAKGALKGVLKG